MMAERFVDEILKIPHLRFECFTNEFVHVDYLNKKKLTIDVS